MADRIVGHPAEGVKEMLQVAGFKLQVPMAVIAIVVAIAIVVVHFAPHRRLNSRSRGRGRLKKPVKPFANLTRVCFVRTFAILPGMGFLRCQSAPLGGEGGRAAGGNVGQTTAWFTSQVFEALELLLNGLIQDERVGALPV